MTGWWRREPALLLVRCLIVGLASWLAIPILLASQGWPTDWDGTWLEWAVTILSGIGSALVGAAVTCALLFRVWRDPGEWW